MINIVLNQIPYYLILLLTFILPKFYKSNKYVYTLFSVYVLFVCFRYGVGWDYFNYSDTIIAGDWRLERLEYLIRQIGLFCHKLQNSQLFIAITGFLTLLLFMYTIVKQSHNVYISIIVFICLPMFFLGSLTTIRYSLAVAVLFLSYNFVNKNKLITLILVTIAFLIHKSSILYIFTLPFLMGKIEISKNINIMIFAVCYTLGTFFPTINFIKILIENVPEINLFLEESSYIGYIENSASGGFSRSPYLYAFINILNFVNYNTLCKDNYSEQNKIYITLYNLGCSLMFILSFDQTISSRVSQFFMLSIILLFPQYNKLKISKYIIYIILIFSFTYQISIKGNHSDFIGRTNCYIPYTFNWKIIN